MRDESITRDALSITSKSYLIMYMTELLKKYELQNCLAALTPFCQRENELHQKHSLKNDNAYIKFSEITFFYE